MFLGKHLDHIPQLIHYHLYLRFLDVIFVPRSFLETKKPSKELCSSFLMGGEFSKIEHRGLAGLTLVKP